jgi:hypothetical protein
LRLFREGVVAILDADGNVHGAAHTASAAAARTDFDAHNQVRHLSRRSGGPVRYEFGTGAEPTREANWPSGVYRCAYTFSRSWSNFGMVLAS